MEGEAVPNLPYDEVVHLSDNDDEIATPEHSKDGIGRKFQGNRGDSPPGHESPEHEGEYSNGEEDDGDEEEADDEDEPPAKQPPQKQQAKPAADTRQNTNTNANARAPQKTSQHMEDTDEDGSEEDEDDHDDDDHGMSPHKVGYNPADYANLPVSQEIKEMFQYITRYKPHNIEIETKMRPFIPDFIPAIGDIDAFLKVPRPDGHPELLGLTVLDEPSSKQSDPTVMDLQLRAFTKQTNAQPMAVRSIEHAEKNPKAITSWISSITELHRSKPTAAVNYSRPMPDIEALMQLWPTQVEEILSQINLPDGDLDLELKDFVQLACGIVDIPVHKKGSNSYVESLHLLFTLYSEFKHNQYFSQADPSDPSGFPPS